jgi:hypothetical protein
MSTYEIRELPAPAGSAALPSVSFLGDPNTGIYSPGADQVAISTNSSQRLVVDASGNVGIGAPNPSALLDLRGSTSTRINLGVTGAASRAFLDYTESGFLTTLDGDGDIRFSPNNTEAVRITTAGRLGLGTSSPDALLTVNGVGAFGAGTAALPSIARSSDLDTGAWFPAANTIAASTAGVERLRIDSTGRVGIGTTSPSAPLDVVTTGSAGNESFIARFHAGVNAGLNIYATPIAQNSGDVKVSLYAEGGGNFSTSSALAFETRNAGARSERARIDSSGRLLVGTSTSIAAPDAAGASRDGSFQLAGNLLATTLQNNHFFNVSGTGPCYQFTKSNTSTIGNHTVVALNDRLGTFQWSGSDGTAYIPAAQIYAQVDGTPGTNDMPGRLVFSTTADGASSPTERLRITNAGVLQVADAGNISVGTTTGTKIGTATTQKLGFYNATPVVQPTAVADATDAATAISQLNALLAHMRTLGLIAT